MGSFELQAQAAVWRRIGVEDQRRGKQPVSIELRLQKIQESASMSNVEKRRALMSKAQRGFEEHVRETVDRVTRMKINGSGGEQKGAAVRSHGGSGGAAVRRSAQVIDLSLKK